MQITSRKLEITKLSHSPLDLDNFISKYQEKFDLNCDDLEDSKDVIISHFADKIVDSKSMQNMKNIIIDFCHLIISQLQTHLMNMDAMHEITCDKDHDYKYYVNADMAAIKTLNWFNEAHKLVYGNKITKLDRFIQQNLQIFKKKNEEFLYKTVYT